MDQNTEKMEEAECSLPDGCVAMKMAIGEICIKQEIKTDENQEEIPNMPTLTANLKDILTESNGSDCGEKMEPSLIKVEPMEENVEVEPTVTATGQPQSDFSQDIQCNLCHKKLGFLVEFIVHFDTMHTDVYETEYECYYCKVRFKYKDQQSHYETLHPHITSLCPICGDPFGAWQNRDLHYQSHFWQGIEPDTQSAESKPEGDIQMATSSINSKTASATSLVSDRQSIAESSRQDQTGVQTGETNSETAISQGSTEHNEIETQSQHAQEAQPLRLGPNSFKCPWCSYRSRRSNDIGKHMRIHTQEKPYSCGMCGAAFCVSSGLYDHMRIHTGQRPYVCQVCSKSFGSRSSLHKHRNTHSGGNMYPCSQCGNTFTQRANLKRHMRRCNGSKGKDSRSSSNLKAKECNINLKGSTPKVAVVKLEKSEHVEKLIKDHNHMTKSTAVSEIQESRRKAEDVVTTIEICNRPGSFAQGGTEEHKEKESGRVSTQIIIPVVKLEKTEHVEQLIKDHNAVKKGKAVSNVQKKAQKPKHVGTNSSSSQGELSSQGSTEFPKIKKNESRHPQEPQPLHMEPNIFKCLWCSYTSRRSADAVKHMRIHTQEKPYKCQTCSAGFRCSSDLTDHMRSHTGQKPYVCGVCSKSFSSRSTLSKHRNTHSGGKTYPCPHCDHVSTQGSNLKRHIHRCHPQ